MKSANTLVAQTGTTIFTIMSALAVQHEAINLGQGFPDTEGPQDILRAAADALMDHRNQYPPLTGVPELRAAVAAANKRFYGLEIDPVAGVCVTSGATEALNSCLTALINPGDEVILIEPMFDTYLPVVKLLGGVPIMVRLEPPNWDLPRAALAAAFSSKTKLLLLNSPMNPTGKVFTLEELTFIAGLLIEYDAYAVCDEVYEHLVFAPAKHIPLMTLPGMAERCLRVGSAGKTFALTGWKIGYISGSNEIVSLAARAHQNITFTSAPNLQRGVAYGLGKPDDYFQSLGTELELRRNIMDHGLRALGFQTLPSDGSYFITADITGLGFAEDDLAFCKTITIEAMVAAIPVSAFYGPNPPTHLVRFAFCKQPAILHEALARLGTWLAQRQAASKSASERLTATG